jgi:ribosomal protein L37AE/L43A
MTANYDCPSCDRRLVDAGASNAWGCQHCSEIVLEAVDKHSERVQEFFRRATSKRWGGLRP